MTKTVLVVGGTGYIGCHVLYELFLENFNVIVIGRFPLGRNHQLKIIEKCTGKKCNYYAIDVTKRKNLLRVFEKHSIDVVIHLAAFKSLGESTSKPLQYYRNNISGLLNILQMCEKFNVSNIVYTSSCTVYGIPNALPIKESDIIGRKLMNPYGKSKFFSEIILTTLYKLSKQLNCVVLRCFNPVGAHQNGMISDGVYGNIISHICRVAAGKIDKILIFGNDHKTFDGTAIRDYVHVSDVARGHVYAAKKLLSHNGYYVYNIGSGIGISLLQLIQIFEEENHIKIRYEYSTKRTSDVESIYCSFQRATTDLGWRPFYNIQDICRHAWSFVQNEQSLGMNNRNTENA